jgi:lactoylglutathione lyase
MRTLHIGLRVADLERSLAFYGALGYEVLGSVPETEFGSLTMLKLPGDEFVTVELVHDPGSAEVGAGGLNHFVIQVESMHDTTAELADHGITWSHLSRPTARMTSGRRGSSTPTATASNWSSGRPGTRTA